MIPGGSCWNLVLWKLISAFQKMALTPISSLTVALFLSSVIRTYIIDLNWAVHDLCRSDHFPIVMEFHSTPGNVTSFKCSRALALFFFKTGDETCVAENSE